MNNTTGASDTSCPLTAPVSDNLQATLYSFLIVTSIVGNSLIIFVIFKNKKMHTVANYLICNMSIADLLITLLPMTWEVIKVKNYPQGEWPMGRFMCTFLYMTIYLSVACSTLSLLVITWDRFFAIMLPFKQIFTKKTLPVLLIAIWTASIGFASPTIYAMDIVTYSGKEYCIEIWKAPFDANKSPMHYTVVLFVGLYALPLLTMAVMYSIMARRLWKRNIPGNRSSEMEKQRVKQKKKVIRMLVIVVCAFAICWLPVFVMQFLFFVHPYYKVCTISIPKSFIFFSFFMQYLASAINPYIYLTCSDAYRNGLQNALCRNRIAPGQNTTLPGITLNKKSATMVPSTTMQTPQPKRMEGPKVVPTITETKVDENHN